MRFRGYHEDCREAPEIIRGILEGFQRVSDIRQNSWENQRALAEFKRSLREFQRIFKVFQGVLEEIRTIFRRFLSTWWLASKSFKEVHERILGYPWTSSMGLNVRQ